MAKDKPAVEAAASAALNFTQAAEELQRMGRVFRAFSVIDDTLTAAARAQSEIVSLTAARDKLTADVEALQAQFAMVGEQLLKAQQEHAQQLREAAAAADEAIAAQKARADAATKETDAYLAALQGEMLTAATKHRESLAAMRDEAAIAAETLKAAKDELAAFREKYAKVPA